MLIVDAGGGTIDISSYVVTSDRPLQVEELFRPECQPIRSLLGTRLLRYLLLTGLLQGGEFVTARAKKMASGKFNIAPLSHLSYNHEQKN